MTGLLALALWASLSPLPNGPIRIGRCETHAYRVELAAGQTLRGAVIQDGADLTITVTRSDDGFVMWNRNYFENHGGRERFLILAERDGEYRLEVRANETSGFYEFVAAPIRATTGDDLLESAGEMALTHRHGGDIFFGVSLTSIRETLEPALAACRAAGAIDCEADVMRELAHARWFAVEDVRGARDLLLASLPLRRKSPDRFAEGDTYNDLGVITRWLGELEDARDHFERVPALKRTTTIPNDPLVMLTAGPVYWQLGELQKAIDTETAALEFWQTREFENREGQAYVRNILGQFALQLGDTTQALRHASEARRIYQSKGHLTGVVETTTRLGTVYDALGEQERALRLYREALALAETIHDRGGQANALLNMGKTLTALERRTEARQSLQKALAMLRKGNRDETHVQLALGNAAKNDTAAIEAYRRVVELTDRSGDAAPRAEAQLAIARIQRDRGKLSAALQSLSAAQEIVEMLRVRIANPEVRASYLAARQKHYDLTIDVLMRMKRSDEALDVSERARARALLDSLQIARIRDTAVDAQLLEREEKLRQRVSGKATALTRLTAAQRDGAEGRVLRSEVESLLAQHQQVRGEIARAGGGESAAVLRTHEVQRLLDRETLVLEYALGESASYLWVIGRDSVRTFALPPKGTLDRLARRVIELVPQTHKREVAVQAQLASQRLADAILGPARELLGRRRLAIVADGALQFVSFGTLPDPAKPEQPLIVDHEVVTLPSASLLAVLRKSPRDAAAQKTVAVFADPILQTGNARNSVINADLMRSASAFGPSAFARLPHTREEAGRIAALVPPDKRLVALDYAASRATAMSGALEDFRIVHFATHGFINPEHPELSGLVLSLYDREGQSQDGFLRLADIYRVRLAADLVVLSACRTALGKDMQREGLVGLTRGFIAAGAPRVVASLWDVRDRATAELMERFYTHMLRDRMTPSSALRAAQVSMLRDPRFRAPFYWGAFVMQGEWK